jgi:hypothetical protein
MVMVHVHKVVSFLSRLEVGLRRGSVSGAFFVNDIQSRDRKSPKYLVLRNPTLATAVC